MAKRKIKIIALTVVVVAAILVGSLYLFGGHLIRIGVERAASTSMGTEVLIGDMPVKHLLGGNVGFADVTVQNVQGYDFPHVMKLESVFIDAVPGSFLRDTIEVRSVELSGVEVFVEQRALRNNLKDMLDEMPARQRPEGPEQKEGKNVNVSKATIEDITVHLMVINGGDEPRVLELKIDPIILEDIGTDKEINSGAIAARITAAISAGVIKQIANELPGEVVRGIESAAGQTVDLGKAVLGEGRKILEETGEQLFEGVRGIFNRENND